MIRKPITYTCQACGHSWIERLNPKGFVKRDGEIYTEYGKAPIKNCPKCQVVVEGEMDET